MRRMLGGSVVFRGRVIGGPTTLPVIIAGVAAIATATSLGLTPGLLPLSATLALEAMMLLVVLLTVVWRLLRIRPAPGWAPRAPASPGPVAAEQVADPARGRMQLDTALFFVAAATVVEVGWRPAGLTL